MKTQTATHTPGPWAIRNDQSGYVKFIQESESGGTRYCVGRTYGNHEIDLANAHLIAAAPELLEALKEAREFVAFAATKLKYQSVGNEFEPNRESAEGTLGRMDQAIAKAEGR